MLRLILVMLIASCASEELGYDVLVLPEDTPHPEPLPEDTTHPETLPEDTAHSEPLPEDTTHPEPLNNDNGDDEYSSTPSPAPAPAPSPTPTPTLTCPEGYVRQYRRFSGFYCKRVP